MCFFIKLGDFILLNKIPVSTIKLPKGRFQACHEVSLFVLLTGKSSGTQNKTPIRGASPPGVSYQLRDENAIGRRRWNITTQERKVCDVEIEIISFVVNGSVKLSIPPERQWLN